MNGTNEQVTKGEAVEEAVITPEVQLISMPESGFSIDREIALIEKNVALFNRIKIVALKLTKPTDWVDMGGPYLMDKGAESIAIAFGVDISNVQVRTEWMDDAKGRYYIVTASGKAYAKRLGRYIEDEGVCSQRDKFFGMLNGKLKEVEDVDVPNIRRKAITNLYGRLIKRVTGLIGVTWEELAAAGISRASLAKVEYKSGGQKASDLTPESKDTKAKLDSMVLRMANNDPKVVSDLIKKFSFWKGDDGVEHSVTDSSKLSSRWLATTYGKAKKEYEATQSGGRQAGEEG